MYNYAQICFIFFLSIVNLSYSKEGAKVDYAYQDQYEKSKDGLKATLYKTFKLKLNLKPDLQEELGKGKEGKEDYYFSSFTDSEKKLKMIAAYNKKKELTYYLLDKKYNLYFAYIKFEYKCVGGRLSEADFFNKNNKKIAMIRYKWQNKKKKDLSLRHSFILTYSSLTKSFQEREHRIFIYGKGSKKHEGVRDLKYVDSAGNTYAMERYIKSDKPITYIRYGHGTGYKRNYTYGKEKPSHTQTYNDDGILIKNDDKTQEQSNDEEKSDDQEEAPKK